jgi:hypothetical protein
MKKLTQLQKAMLRECVTDAIYTATEDAIILPTTHRLERVVALKQLLAAITDQK